MKQQNLITQHNKSLLEETTQLLEEIDKVEGFMQNSTLRDMVEYHEDTIEILKYRIKENINLLLKMV